MTKKTAQPDPITDSTGEVIELPRSIEPEGDITGAPDPLDVWVDVWANSPAASHLTDRLKTELKARGLVDPALVGPHHLGDLNAAIRAALRLDAHALLDAAQKARGEK